VPIQAWGGESDAPRMSEVMSNKPTSGRTRCSHRIILKDSVNA
jgi:hypothetical protein